MKPHLEANHMVIVVFVYATEERSYPATKSRGWTIIVKTICGDKEMLSSKKTIGTLETLEVPLQGTTGILTRSVKNAGSGVKKKTSLVLSTKFCPRRNGHTAPKSPEMSIVNGQYVNPGPLNPDTHRQPSLAKLSSWINLED